MSSSFAKKKKIKTHARVLLIKSTYRITRSCWSLVVNVRNSAHCDQKRERTRSFFFFSSPRSSCMEYISQLHPFGFKIVSRHGLDLDWPVWEIDESPMNFKIFWVTGSTSVVRSCPLANGTVLRTASTQCFVNLPQTFRVQIRRLIAFSNKRADGFIAKVRWPAVTRVYVWGGPGLVCACECVFI